MPPGETPVATDLSAIPAEGWSAYFFDRPVVEGAFVDSFEGGVPVALNDRERALASLTAFLEGFGRHAAAYSSAQVDQAVWALWNRGYDLHELFWEETLPWPLRERAIRAMFVPFDECLRGHPTGPEETGFMMWWDLNQEGWWARGAEEDKARVRGAYLETLVRILALDDEECQGAALHGLGHLEHPDRPVAVQAFIDARKGLKKGSYAREYAEQCRDGTVY